MADQLTENAVALGEGADPGDLLLGDPDRVEGGETPAVRTDHAERRVLRVDQHPGGFDDAVQRLLQIQLASDREHRLQQAVHPVLGSTGRVQPRLKLLQQLVQPQLWQPYTGLVRLLGACHLCLLGSLGRADTGRSGRGPRYRPTAGDGTRFGSGGGGSGGRLGADSGNGVTFARVPATGRVALYGDRLVDAQAEDVVAGTTAWGG